MPTTATTSGINTEAAGAVFQDQNNTVIHTPTIHTYSAVDFENMLSTPVYMGTARTTEANTFLDFEIGTTHAVGLILPNTRVSHTASVSTDLLNPYGTFCAIVRSFARYTEPANQVHLKFIKQPSEAEFRLFERPFCVTHTSMNYGWDPDSERLRCNNVNVHTDTVDTQSFEIVPVNAVPVKQNNLMPNLKHPKDYLWFDNQVKVQQINTVQPSAVFPPNFDVLMFSTMTGTRFFTIDTPYVFQSTATSPFYSTRRFRTETY